MVTKSKRLQDIEKGLEQKQYSMQEALDVLTKCSKVKFDESVDLSLKMGIDPKKSDQQVRGIVALPHGTGKKVVVLVFAAGDKAKEAVDAGADYCGAEELIEKVKQGWTEFDAVVTTPDMMREVGKLGKILGPRGLMPTPKAGTVTNDVAKAVSAVKAGRIEFKGDKQGVVNNAVGKVSFSIEHLLENIRTYLQAVSKAKPRAMKGVYFQSAFISTTMGPGLPLDLNTLITG